MPYTRRTIKVDALGSITSNCTLLRSTPDDAKDVDRARYGDEGKNSWHFVSNELKVVYVDEAVETLNGIRGDEQVDLYLDKGD